MFSCAVVLACRGRPVTVFEQVEQRLRDYEHRFSRFVRDNELAAVNGSDGRWTPVSSELERMLVHALDVFVQSRGLVNIAVSDALDAAGYVRPWPARWRAADRAGAEVRPLTEVLEVRHGHARLQPGHRVDLGAIAKGVWADEVLDLLGDDAAASLGGDVSARGTGPEGEGWPVGLPNGRTVVVVDGGVATSGTSKRRSATAHHVIDPRTGLPARSGLREVTVIATSAATADWLATAALVSGTRGLDLAGRRDVSHVITEPGDTEE